MPTESMTIQKAQRRILEVVYREPAPRIHTEGNFDCGYTYRRRIRMTRPTPTPTGDARTAEYARNRKN